MIKVICDKCGVDLSKDSKVGKIQIKIHESQVLDTQFRFFDMSSADIPYQLLAGETEHYCEKCIEEILEFIHTTPDTGSKKETVIVEKAEKKRVRKMIDYGKIMALKNAGWDNEKIAEEMHMTKLSVSQAICRYKKQGGIIL